MFKIFITFFILIGFRGHATDYDLIFSSDKPTAERWKQVYLFAKNSSYKEAQAFLSRCVSSKDWFLQLAALKSYSVLFQKQGLTKAKVLLKNSSSLVVRSEAVNYIKRHGDIKDVGVLFEALLNPKNFRGKTSLAIRDQIIGAIEAIDRQNIYKDKWKKLIHDSNPKVKSVARLRAVN